MLLPASVVWYKKPFEGEKPMRFPPQTYPVSSLVKSTDRNELIKVVVYSLVQVNPPSVVLDM
jgi:hypothetical protein